jgi:prepilin-type N-terminal cleavage/methylation domain-containing protein
MQQRGFTLLETLIAIAILAGVGMAILSWVNTSQQTLAASAIAQRERDLTMTVLSEMKQVDLATEPRGQREFGDWRFEYNSEAFGEELKSKPLIRGKELKAQMMKVLVTVNYRATPDQVTWSEFPLQFEQVRYR